MATKYQFDRLRSRIVSHIETDWPQSLQEWDEYWAEVKTQVDRYPHDPVTCNNERFLEPVSAIRLARECNIPSILPAAFYLLSTVPRSTNWEDYYPTSSAQIPFHVGGVARWKDAEVVDLLTLLQGQERLMGPDDAEWLFLQTASEADVCDACHTSLVRLTEWLRTLNGPPFDHLKYWAECCEEKRLKRYGVCSACIRRILRSIAEVRASTWRSLARYFGLTEE